MESESSIKSKEVLQSLKDSEVEFEGSLIASTLAHEIRNPLQSIRLQLDLASRGGSAEDALLSIRDHVNRLESVVEKVQKLSEKFVTQLEKANLSDLIESAMSSLKFWLSASGIETRVHIAWEGAPICFLDKELIEQVLLNLFMNAIQVMPAGGTLTVYVTEEIDHAVIEVSDTGPGIPADVLNKIGTPFFTTKQHGNGLGIAFCKTIAALHGGSLELTSSHKSGAPTGTQVVLRILKDPTPVEDIEHVQ